MSNKVIEVENVSKQYRLGSIGTGSFSHDINRWWHTVRGKEDPYLKIGEANDRTVTGDSQYVWSLKDINFNIEQGDAVGIIGRNGAGKSTLLKILSRVTSPTTGSIKITGRIASLLEVGTGFHPELSGRENIFLNGAILGMRKKEIKRKFDEIVDFAGVERYIDTPVKRYSSGMYVRLAFGVAAHLESEILIVDEVLAVGDAEFQKKCLGKMSDVSQGEGRTVLFVSHNMASVNKLCKNSILLKNGRIDKIDTTEKVIPNYLALDANAGAAEIIFPEDKNKAFQILSARMLNENGQLLSRAVNVGEGIYIEVIYKFSTSLSKIHLTLIVNNNMGEIVYFFDRTDFSGDYFDAKAGVYKSIVRIPNPLLKPSTYNISLGLADLHSRADNHKHSIISFEIADIQSVRSDRPGYIYYPVDWPMEKID